MLPLRFALFDGSVSIRVLAPQILRQRGGRRWHGHVLEHVFVADESGGVRIHRAARRVVPMRVAVDDISDGHIEPLSEDTFEPSRHLGADWFDENDPLGSDHEHRQVVVHPCEIDLAGELSDLLSFVLGLLIQGALLGQGRMGDEQRGGQSSGRRFSRTFRSWQLP